MIFQRREKRNLFERVRDLVQPRKGWRRGFRYIGKRVQRLPDTPHRIALGFACGAIASFTPFFTLHALVAALLAWTVRGNVISAVFGTIVGNPISFPLIAATSMKLGSWMMGRIHDESSLDTKLSFDYVTSHPFDFLQSIFAPYLLGGIGPGLLVGLICYVLIRPAVAGFQLRRRTVLSERADSLVAERLARQTSRSAAPSPAGGVAAADSEHRHNSLDALRRASLPKRGAGVVPFPKRGPASAEEAKSEPAHEPSDDDDSKSRAL